MTEMDEAWRWLTEQRVTLFYRQVPMIAATDYAQDRRPMAWCIRALEGWAYWGGHEQFDLSVVVLACYRDRERLAAEGQVIHEIAQRDDL